MHLFTNASNVFIALAVIVQRLATMALYSMARYCVNYIKVYTYLYFYVIVITQSTGCLVATAYS